jgi:hypothetical protein
MERMKKMEARYSVVQFVPDPVADERINVGVIAFGPGDEVYARFLRNWSRVRHFGTKDIAFLQEFAKSVTEATSETTLPGLGKYEPITEALVERMVNWNNSIQLTEPRASLRPAAELVDEMARKFLREPPRRTRGFRDRRAAVALAKNMVREALFDQAGAGAEDLVKTHYTLQGNLDEHQFDLAVANGLVLSAAQGLSFEVPPTGELAKDIDATAWAIDDVKKKDRTVPLAVIALPPKTKSRTFERAVRVFEGLKADVVLEEDVPDWASDVAALTLETSKSR